MGCVRCDDGSWECGVVVSDLCDFGGEWELAGTFCLKVLVRVGPSGKCMVRLEPYTPEETV
jgi:hypothetical protein